MSLDDMPQRSVIWPLAVALLLVGPALLDVGPAAADTTECQRQSESDEPKYVNAPLWAKDVEFSFEFNTEDNEDEPRFVDGGVAFVQPGDVIEVSFVVENRVSEDCQSVVQVAQAHQGLRDVRVLANHSATDGWDETRDCPDLSEPGDVCEVTARVHVPAGSQPRELPVRFVAVNDQRAYVGVERVMVVSQLPDLDAEGIQLLENQDGIKTTYETSNMTEVEIVVRNVGNYPHWSPNGGDAFWGRSALDADGDGVANNVERKWGTDPHDVDTDGDGLDDLEDKCPTVGEPDGVSDPDPDGDGYNNACDADDDGDGMLDYWEDPDAEGNYHNLNESTKTDDADINDNGKPDGDEDWDGDGIDNKNDDCAYDPKKGFEGDDYDSENPCDPETDDDNVPDPLPSFPDTDGDGLVDQEEEARGSHQDDSNTDGDTNADGSEIEDGNDNCPVVPNPDQDDANGDGVGDACDVDMIDTSYSPYDPESPEVPLCVGRDSEDSPWPTDVTTDDLACSYRPGKPLPIPAWYNATRERHDGTVEAVTEDVLPAGKFLSHDLAEDGKQDALLPGTDATGAFLILEREHRAGLHDVNLKVGHDGTDWVFPGEDEFEDNELEAEVDILGVDLEIHDGDVDVLTEDDDCGSSPTDPCPAGQPMHVSASFHNDGSKQIRDAGDDPLLLKRAWIAAAYVNGEPVEEDLKGESGFAIFEDDQTIPSPGDPEKELWGDPPLRIPSPAGGGKVTIEVRLDHPENYEFRDLSTDEPDGRVAERTEGNDCPGPGEDTDNVYCKTLYFEDTQAPEVHELNVDAPRSTEDGDDATPAAREGEAFELEAIVEDPSITGVKAILELPNGTTVAENMTREDPHADAWTLERSLVGTLGNVTYNVEASDEFDHTVTSTLNETFRVVEWPKEVTGEAFQVNGNDALDDGHEGHDHGDAPAYQGTADDPENWFRIEANVTGTGHASDYATDNKTVQVEDTEGEVRHEVPMDVYTVCTLWNNLTDAEEGTGEGSQCRESNQEDHIEVQDERPRFFVDTRCDHDSDPEDAAEDCHDVPDDVHDAWSNVTLGWVGTFNVTVNVTDVHNRSAGEVFDAGIADVDGAPNASDAGISPTEVPAGGTVEAEVNASDELEVERVFLDLVKPNGTTTELNLTLDPETAEGDGTGNGTYDGTFGTGRFEALDQAGAYNASVVVEDFAENRSRVWLPNVTVQDDQAPEIDALESVPAERQEAGGTVNFELEISDDTEPKPPVVRLERPGTGTTVHELSYNDTLEVYTLPTPLEATLADVGTWDYTVTVEDWVGHSVEAAGSLEVVENLPPQAVDWSPGATGLDGRAHGPEDPTIQVDVVDFGHGVNESSIELRVDGTQVDPEIEPIENGYRLSHEPTASIPYPHGTVVNATVSAEDLSEPTPLVAENLTHTFVVDARPPDGGLSVDPSVTQQDGQTVIGASSELTLQVQDADAGPAPSEMVVEQIDGDQNEVTEEIDPGERFRLRELHSSFEQPGRYRVTITPVDAAGNEGDEVVEYLLLDEQPPVVEVFVRPDRPREFVAAEAQDDANVEEAWISYSADGGGEGRVNMTLENGTWTGQIPTLPANTTVEYVVHARDTFGNVGKSLPERFEAGNTPPEIDIVRPSPGAVLAGDYAVRWNANDVERAASELTVSLYYSEEGDSFQPIPGAQDLDNTGEHQVNASLLPEGTVTLRAIVFDGSVFGSDSVEIEAAHGPAAIREVEWEGATPENGTLVADAGSELTFKVWLASTVEEAWVNLTADGETVTSSRLTAGDDGEVWTADVPIPDDEGSYATTVTAVTADGERHTEEAHTVNVQSDSMLGLGNPGISVTIILVGLAATAGALFIARRHG